MGRLTVADVEGVEGVGPDAGAGDGEFVPTPVVAVVGRPNVGKSTLVNRILGSRQAVVQDTPGVTRDRVAYDASWRGRAFTLVDTGGWEPSPGSEAGQASRALAEQVTAQARMAVEAADAVLFVVDVAGGITDSHDAGAGVARGLGQPGGGAASTGDGPPGAPGPLARGGVRAGRGCARAASATTRNPTSFMSMSAGCGTGDSRRRHGEPDGLNNRPGARSGASISPIH